MNYYHVLWTRPYFRPGTPASKDIVLWDFELLIWLLSALQARQYGPLRLITDSRGALAAERAGLTPFYRAGISIELDTVPQCLDTEVFWAGGKLYAFGAMETPCVCLDLDAVLWQPLEPASTIMALHREGRDWAWYYDNQAEFGQFGFAEPDWDWNVDPFNTGVIYLAEPELARDYARTACGFAERYSRETCSNPSTRPAGSNAMLFAEQRLLSMCAARHGIAVQPVTKTTPLATCLPKNPECLHLWRAKLAYKICMESRLALVNWAIEYLLEHFGECRPVLTRWGFDHQQRQVEQQEVLPADFVEIHKGDLRFSLLKNLTGNINVRDLTTGISRKASQGSMVWSGEIVHPEPGAECELEIIGVQSLKLRAMA